MTKTIGIGLMSLMIISPQQPPSEPCGGWILWMNSIDRQYGTSNWSTMEGYDNLAECRRDVVTMNQKMIPLQKIGLVNTYSCFPSGFQPR